MKTATSVLNAMVDAAVDSIDQGSGAGYIQIRTGSAPTNTTDANTGTLLATNTMSDPACGSASGGSATANSISNDSSIDNTGTAAHFRIFDSNNVCLFQGTVGTSGTDIVFDSVSFVAGGVCSITSLTFTLGAGS